MLIGAPLGFWSSPVGDPYWSDVEALLPMDGTNGSTTFTDLKGNTWTPTNATITTAYYKFGGASGNFTNSTGKITAPGIASATGDFTIECWFYFTAAMETPTYIGLFDMFGDTYNCIYFTYGAVSLGYNNTGVVSSVIPNTNAWNAIALVRHGSSFYVYLNGNSIAALNVSVGSGSLLHVGSTFVIGWGGGVYLTSYVDEFRVTNGVARYTSNYTPATQAFPTHG